MYSAGPDPACSREDTIPRIGRSALVGLYYVLLAGALAFRIWPVLDTSVIGGIRGPDLVGTAWTWWWTAFSLTEGLSPASCPWTYAPIGLYPVAQFNVVDGLFAAPLISLLGPVAGFNLTVVAIIASVGAASHAVCRWAGASTWAAIMGGSALMLSNSIAFEIEAGRAGQAFATFLILAIGLWWRLIADDGPRRMGWCGAVLTGLLTALTFLEYWYYGAFLAFAVAALLATRLGALDRRRLVQILGASTVALMAILPFVWVLVSMGESLPGMTETQGWRDHGALGRGEPGLNWAIDFSLWLGWPLADEPLKPNMVPSHTLLLCALAPLIVVRARRLGWLAVGAVGYVLSLGPYPRGQSGEILGAVSLPYLWLADVIPFMDRLWWPYRAAPLLLLALTVLAAKNLTELGQDLGARRHWLAVAAAVIAVVEGLWINPLLPYQITHAPKPSPAYAALDGPAITLPMFGFDAQARFALWMQMWHQQPISYGIGGHLDGHRPAGVDALVESNGLLHALRAYEDGPLPRIDIQAEDVDALIDAGFRYVVLDTALYSTPRITAVASLNTEILQAVFGPPIVEDDRTAIWALHPISDRILDPGPGNPTSAVVPQ